VSSVREIISEIVIPVTEEAAQLSKNHMRFIDAAFDGAKADDFTQETKNSPIAAGTISNIGLLNIVNSPSPSAVST